MRAPSSSGIALCSAIRGRERWEVRVIRDRPDLARALEHALSESAGVTSVKANPVTGRVLVHYTPQPERIRVDELIRAALAGLSGETIALSVGNARGIREFLRTAVPEPRHFIAPILVSVASFALQFAQGLLFVSTISQLRSPDRKSTGGRLMALGVGALILGIGESWVRYHRGRMWQAIGQATEQRIRTRLIARIQRQDLAFFDRHDTASLINVMTVDAARIGELVETAGDQLIDKSLTIGITAVLLVLASPVLAAVVCLPMALLLLPSKVFGKPAAQQYAVSGKKAENLAQMLENNLAGIMDVKSFSAESYEARRLREGSVDLLASTRQATSTASKESVFLRGIYSIGFCVTAAFGSQQVASGQIARTDYLRIVYQFPRSIDALRSLDEFNRLYRSSESSVKRLRNILDARPAIRSGTHRLPRKKVRGEVIFDDVSFGYTARTPVLHNISFHLRPGETIGIVGRTGSGKTTLLRLLMRFYEVNSGRILVDGQDIRNLDLRDLRSAIGLVSQEQYLFQGNVRENISYGRPNASPEEVEHALRMADAKHLLSSLSDGLDTEVGERGRRLSGGERQRIALARALLKGSPILALDEVTSHLDYETEAAVRKSVRRTKASVLMVAHRLATIRDANQILVLDRGRIREAGTHQKLLAQGKIYSGLWQLQTGENLG